MANEYDKILGEIKKGTDSISGATKEVEKINNFIDDSKGDVKQGFKNLMSKLDAINTIASWDTNIKKIGTSSVSDNVSGIAKEVTWIVSYVNNISTHVTEMTGYLKTIKEKIEGFSSIYPTGNGVSNASGSTNSVDGIHDTVKKIYTLLGEIKNSVDKYVNNGTTGDADLDALILENKKKAEALKNKENAIREEASLRRRYENDGFDAIKDDVKKLKDKKGRTIESEKDYLRYTKEKDKERDRRREKLKNPGAGAAKAVSTTTDIINSTGIISKEKPSASALADKGIGLISKLGVGGQIAGAIMQVAKNLFELASKNDRATSDFARTIGGNHVAKVNAGESVATMIRDLNWRGDKYAGYRMDDAFSAMTEIAEARGRTTERIDAQTLRSAIDLKRFGIGGEAINNFDTFGKSIEETDRYFTKLYGEVSKKGLSFKNVSKAVNDNLKMAQSHTFTNGLRGLERMAEKSVQLKYNMQQVFQFAEKVSDVEEAIKTSATLSVLGGNFAQFSNPMQLLYEGLNDTEALNDRILKMFSGKAYWDKDKKEMNMSALDREFIKQAAKGVGLDPNEMLNMAFNEGKINRIGKQITPGVSKEVADYIKNVAELDENGNAFVTFGSGHTQQRVSVDELSDENKEQLQKEVQAREEKNAAKLGDIWRNTSNIGEQMDNLLSFLQEKLGMWVYQMFVSIARKEDNRRTIAEGEGGDELKAKRRRVYESEALNHNAFWGGRKRWAKNVAAMEESEIDERIKALEKAKNEPQGNSPGGFSGEIKGPSHWNGGVLGTFRGQIWEAEGGETLINKQSSKKYKNELAQIQNGTFNPYSYANNIVKNDMNKMFQPLRVAGSQNQVAQNGGGQVGNNNISGKIKVDIPQTITINIAGGGKIGDYDIRPIIMRYVDEIMKEMQMRKSFGAFDKENFHNQSDVLFYT